MEKIITKHLKKMKIEPRGDDFYIQAAEEMTNEKHDDPKKARVTVREEVSKGQIQAENDNIDGLKNQVIEEKKAQMIGRGFKISDSTKALIFKRPLYSLDKVEKYLDRKHIKYGKPKVYVTHIIVPLQNVKKGEKTSLQILTKGIKALTVNSKT